MYNITCVTNTKNYLYGTVKVIMLFINIESCSMELETQNKNIRLSPTTINNESIAIRC